MVASSTLSPARMSGTELRRENVFTVCDILSSEYLDQNHGWSRAKVGLWSHRFRRQFRELALAWLLISRN